MRNISHLIFSSDNHVSNGNLQKISIRQLEEEIRRELYLRWGQMVYRS